MILHENSISSSFPTSLQNPDLSIPFKIALASAPDGGIAGHESHGFQIQGQQQGIQPHPRPAKRRLASRVARADDNKISQRSFLRYYLISSESVFDSGKSSSRKKEPTKVSTPIHCKRRWISSSKIAHSKREMRSAAEMQKKAKMRKEKAHFFDLVKSLTRSI